MRLRSPARRWPRPCSGETPAAPDFRDANRVNRSRRRATDTRRHLGNAGEKAAERFLKKAGYRILARNYACRTGELDLICFRDECIVFVEVKTLESDDFDDPESKITPGKQRRLQRAARDWLDRHDRPDCAYRFDAVSVVLPEGGRPAIRHIEEAFLPCGSWD